MTVRHDKSKLSNLSPETAGKHFSPLNIAINDGTATGSVGGVPYDPINTAGGSFYNETTGDVYADDQGYFRFSL